MANKPQKQNHVTESLGAEFRREKNMSGNRGYNKVPNTVPIKK